MKPLSALSFVALGLVASGCVVSATATDGPPLTGAAQSGSLGLAKFQYACDSSTLVCAQDGNAAAFPSYIATGARFKLTGRYDGESPATALVLSPIARELVSTDPDGTLVALQAGWGGVELKKRGAGETVDFAMFRIATPSKMVFFSTYGSSTTSPVTGAQSWKMSELGSRLTVSQRTLVQAIFRSSGGESLAGEVPVDFKVADPSIVDVSSLARGRVELTPRKKGTTEISAEGGGIKATLAIEVTGGAS
ncbi:MAG: hypothetical protein JNL38_41550 [Myxococcales bacterium]|jgi:hypothetical protein|nr:hypothetical protein [Myxococcales bacterium]